MMCRKLGLALLASACCLTGGQILAQANVPAVTDGLSGIVTSSAGPEAGVWVIAETKDLPTRFIKIVVTDDQGRYVVPQLPKAHYKVWVRGYGLVDSTPVDAAPGQKINLTASVAPNTKAAAQYYPASYWFALIRPPAMSDFPGTGPEGNGIAPSLKTQQDWLVAMHAKGALGCLLCHQIGDKATRELSNNSLEGWSQRILQARALGDQTIGDHGGGYAVAMQNSMALYGRDRGLKMFADWSDRIAKGEVPPAPPPRPIGVERNLVLTEWDWGNSRFMHDETSSDRRDPNVNANGASYGVAANNGFIEILDPRTHKASEVEMPGANKLYPHTIVMDQKARVWVSDLGPAFFTDTPARPDRPDYCTNGAVNKFAQYYPAPGKAAVVHMYDPATKKVTDVPDCFGSHHLNFGYDKNNTLYMSGSGEIIGWIDTKIWDDTHDPQKAVGWCPLVLDTKETGITKVAAIANGEPAIVPDRTQWNQPGKPADPKKDTRIATNTYGMEPNPVDGSMWYGGASVPGALVRFERGAHPPESCKTEFYEPPKLPDGTYAAYSPRGISFDSKGIAWVSFGSGQVGSFDRSKCKILRGPESANGQHCVEGWTLYPGVGPTLPGTNGASADFFYQSWVDLKNSLGLGKDIPVTTAANSDAILVLTPDAKSPGGRKIVTLRVPYPLGFYTRWVDGRIDDPKTGWKERGAWATYSDIPVWHQEGGDTAGPELVKFQMRPDPLAH